MLHKYFTLPFVFTMCIMGLNAQAQVAINTDNSAPNSAAMLDIKSSDKGILIPRIALTGINSLSPLSGSVEGMLIWNTATAFGVKPGFYTRLNNSWQRLLHAGTGTNLYLGGFAGEGLPTLPTSVYSNTLLGQQAMEYATGGSDNTVVGHQAGWHIASGEQNVIIGSAAVLNSTTSSFNVIIGSGAAGNSTIGNYTTLVGTNASAASFQNSIAIGYNAYANATNKIRLGNSSISVIEGQVAYSFPSDERFKYNVKDNIPGLDFIKKLKPVTYNFDNKKFENFIHPNQSAQEKAAYEKVLNGIQPVVQSGFLAQEVAAAAKELGYDFDGVHAPTNENDYYSVSYSQFIMPLVKAVQEQQTIIEQQKEKINQMNAQLNQLEVSVQALIQNQSSNQMTSKK